MPQATLYVHCDTSGAMDIKLDADDPKQTHLLRLSALLVNGAHSAALPRVLVIEPTIDMVFEPGAVAAHGITPSAAARVGTDLGSALANFDGLAAQADRIAGFSIEYQMRVLRGAYLRAGMTMPSLPTECIMRKAAQAMGYSRVSMVAAHRELVGSDMPPVGSNPLESGADKIRAVAAIDHAITRIVERTM